MKFNVVIPNYNGAQIIKKNLPGVLSSLQSYEDLIVTIVDDGSSEQDYFILNDFIRTLKDQENKVRLIRKEKNTGFSSAVNLGVKSSESQFIIFLNSDVSPEKKFLDPIVKDFQKNNNLFGVGCLDKSIENDHTVFRGRGLAKWERGLLIHKKGEIDKEDTFWISAGSCVIKTEIFNNLGGLDEIYDPFYWEDIDLSYRAQKAGYEIMFENKSQVFHMHEEGSIKTNFSKNKISIIAYRNQFIFIWKNITDLNLLISHLLWMPYHMAKALVRADFPFFYGILIALVKLPDIIKRRNKQKNSYKKTDSEIIKRQ